MESFRKNVECIERRCRKYEKVLALFDYDGTLSPIVRDPRRASMSPKHREWITRLTRDPKVEVGIVTGRDLHDIRKRLAMPKLLVAGSHGYEIVRRGKLVLKRSARDFAPMEDLAQELKAALGDVPRLSIEHKQYSIAIHYRRVPPKDRARVRRTVDRLAAPYCEAHDWTITHQKMNREIRPADKGNKGKAIGLERVQRCNILAVGARPDAY